MQKKEFQLTPSRRATGFPNVHGCYEAFQLTPSRRATSAPPVSRPGNFYFNSRPHGGRRFFLLIFCSFWCISTHALTEGDVENIIPIAHTRIISTHALTEGDQSIHPAFYPSRISTHALTEGDVIPLFQPQRQSISTHALTEGDSGVIIFLCHVGHFNSRPHGGRRYRWNYRPGT